jgi:hypothetical protein
MNKTEAFKVPNGKRLINMIEGLGYTLKQVSLRPDGTLDVKIDKGATVNSDDAHDDDHNEWDELLEADETKPLT